MSKVILSGLGLMAFATVSLAQTNTATVNQNGDSQTANTRQTGNYLQSTITQDKQNSETSFGSYATIVQTSTGAGGNAATINQNLWSSGNRAGVTQAGGTGNSGTIYQSAKSGNTDGTPVTITGATSAAAVKAAGGNWADILQSGNSNANTSID